MKLCLIAVAALVLAGCGATAERYAPGENFGDSGATRCKYQTTVNATSTLPACAP